MKKHSVIDEIRKILELHDVKLDVEDSIVIAKINDTPFSLVIDLTGIDKDVVNMSLKSEEDPRDYLERLLDEYDDMDSFRDAVESIMDEIHNIDSKLTIVLRKKGVAVESSVAEDLSDIEDILEDLVEERG